LARPLQKSLLAAALVLGAGWGSPVQPGQTDDGPATAPVITSPSLALSARRGVVTLVGHTVSRRHEARLQQALARHFPDRDHAVEFRPFGPAPDWWAEATVELVGAIAAARAPRVKLDDRGLIVRALARQSAAARDSVVSIARSLPVALETDVRILDAGPDIAVRSLCTRHFGAFRHDPVHFFESQTQMRPSAQPALERVVALAAACRGATISITGHTDSSGDEAWNQRLSLERARAVGDWLVARGVQADRIALTGAGSSEPIAGNDTRYGRSLNRRIDIGFAYDD
jgi:outer membrane protein OmpA-like peptidoglycan-associated protein